MQSKPWYRLKDPALLEKRISDLDLQLAGTAVAPLIQRLYGELHAKGLIFFPPVFLADEWFCPVGVPAIGIPFYLVHSRLRRLEQKIMLEAEGATKTEFMRLIRHEAGHAYAYAYHLNKKKKWIKLFGPSSKEYPEPETYRVRPYSRSYVIHLDNLYAQSHPDEDFAETFAVWLTPGMKWQRRYRNWKAYEKLLYIDDLMKSLKEKEPLNRPRFRPQEHSGLRIKLKTYYQRKKKLYADDFPDFFDSDLKKLFTDIPEMGSSLPASRYLKDSKENILNAVAFWTRERKYTVGQLLNRLIGRCDELKLYTYERNRGIDLQVTAFISSMVMNYIYTGKLKRPR